MSSRVAPVTLKIPITKGVGFGPTTLAAFDAALGAADVGNFNLLRLSSVVPPHAEIVVCDGPIVAGGGWGDRLYVVTAEERTATPGETVAAGVGWVQDPSDRAGLFVEHHGTSEKLVRFQITSGLAALVSTRPYRSFGPPEMVVASAACESLPVCALVVAVYASEPW